MAKYPIDIIEGIVGIEPQMTKIDFDIKHIIVYLEDGRVIWTPLKYFPSLKKGSKAKRMDYDIFDNGHALDIHGCSEIYHIRDFLGIPEKYLNL